jgi:hypothetical protein
MRMPFKVNRKFIVEAVVYLLMLLALAWYWYSIVRYKANVPYRDDYAAVLQYLIQYVGAPSVWDKLKLLFLQHGSYYIVLDRLVFSIYYELFHTVNFGFFIIVGNLGWMGAVFALVLYIRRKYALPTWALLPLPLLLLSFRHAEAMLFAMLSIHFYWQLLFAILFFICLEEHRPVWAFVLFVLALFTSGGGIALLPLGIVYLAVHKQWKPLVGFSLFAVVIAALYLIGYDFSSGVVLSNILKPVQVIHFFVQFLGGVSPTRVPFFGASLGVPLGVLIGGAAIYFLIKRRKFDFLSLIIGMGFLIDGLGALTRSQVGPNRALNSYYAIYSLLICICIYIGILTTFATSPTLRRYAVAGATLAALLYWGGFVVNYEFDHRFAELQQARIAGMVAYTHGDISLLNLDNRDKGAAILDNAKQLGIYDPASAAQ